MTTGSSDLIHVATLLGPHGLKGWVKLKVYLEDLLMIAALGELTSSSGRQFSVLKAEMAGQGLVKVKLHGIDGIDAAEALGRCKLFVSPDQLPDLPDDEVYFRDLPEMEVVLEDGTSLGVIDHVFDSGAHGVLVLKADAEGKEVCLPYVDEVVLRVEKGNRTVVVSSSSQAFFDL